MESLTPNLVSNKIDIELLYDKLAIPNLSSHNSAVGYLLDKDVIIDITVYGAVN